MQDTLLRKKEEIIKWLNRYDIKHYSLIENPEYGFVVDVAGNVDLNDRNLGHIGVKFNCIKGYFDCANNKLTSLKGAPEIISGSFNCAFNKLTTLEHCPKEIGENFHCDYNKLTSLEGVPAKVEGNFGCAYNQLKILKFIPKIINGYLQCSHNKLEELFYETFPQYVKVNVNLRGNIGLQEYEDMSFQDIQLTLRTRFEKALLESSFSKSPINNKVLKL